MRTWLGSMLLVVVGIFAVASGCGTSTKPPGSRTNDDLPDASDGGGSGNGTSGNGSGAVSGGFVLGNGGGNSDNCPSTCAQLNANCGFVTDSRCTGVIQCGTCKDGEFCGGDGESRCGTNGTGEGGCSGADCVSCAVKTCADQGFDCGPAGDTCGNKLDCGPISCAIKGQTCGGAGKPGKCGCTGACSQIPDCSAAAIKTTSLSGVVFDPAGVNPLYHVFVYVANDPTDPDLKSFKPGVTCDVCGASAAGSPLPDATGNIGTYTDTTGHFKLTNVPVGKGLSVVIQLGRWRRVFTIDVDKSCDDNVMPNTTFLMPSKKSQGDIPLFAMVTGKSDSLECVLKKIGLDSTEFTNPAGGGRVQFYLGDQSDGMGNGYGENIDVNTPRQAALFVKDANNVAKINDYDMTILACQGATHTESAADQASLRNYAASGGRVFVSHYNYRWLYQNDASPGAAAGANDNWSEIAKWHATEADRSGTGVGHIDLVSNPKGPSFQSWLENVGASTAGSGTAAMIAVNHSTDSVSAVAGQTQQWLWRYGALNKKCPDGVTTCMADADCGGTAGSCLGDKVPLHLTYNTPVNLKEDLTATPPAVQCGRVLFSDFHVKDVNGYDKLTFPAGCDPTGTAMTPQEKMFEYMIFDLGSCVPPAKACVPATACPAGDDCGYAPDGCGGLISCGVCPTGQSCGVGNPPVPNKCGKGTQSCTPKTCAAQKLECGPAADGCGAKIDSCGQCDIGQLCVSGKCVGVN